MACSAIPRLVDLFGVAETIAFFVTLTHRELNGVTGAWSCSALKLKGAKPGRVYVDEVPRSPDDVTCDEVHHLIKWVGGRVGTSERPSVISLEIIVPSERDIAQGKATVFVGILGVVGTIVAAVIGASAGRATAADKECPAPPFDAKAQLAFPPLSTSTDWNDTQAMVDNNFGKDFCVARSTGALTCDVETADACVHNDGGLSCVAKPSQVFCFNRPSAGVDPLCFVTKDQCILESQAFDPEPPCRRYDVSTKPLTTWTEEIAEARKPKFDGLPGPDEMKPVMRTYCAQRSDIDTVLSCGFKDIESCGDWMQSRGSAFAGSCGPAEFPMVCFGVRQKRARAEFKCFSRPEKCEEERAEALSDTSNRLGRYAVGACFVPMR